MSTNKSVDKSVDKLDPERLAKAKFQQSQKCPGCFQYMTRDEKIIIYTGDDTDYYGWMIHADCKELM